MLRIYYATQMHIAYDHTMIDYISGCGVRTLNLGPLGLRPAATQNAKTQRANPLGYTHLMIAVCVCDVHVWISTINGCQLFRGRFDRNTLQHSPTFSNDVLHRSNGYQIDHTWTTNHHESTRWDSKCLVFTTAGSEDYLIAPQT